MAQKGLLYSLIARGSTVLSEHRFGSLCAAFLTFVERTKKNSRPGKTIISVVAGNANLIAQRILEKVPPEDSRRSYSQDRHIFHVAVSRGIIYLCMAEEDLGRRIAYAFLEDIKTRFLEEYGSQAQDLRAYEIDDSFSLTLKERMDFFSSDRNADQINRVKGQLGEVKNIMIDNIEKVLDRGERIELLVDKTDRLQMEATNFNRTSRTLKRKTQWQSYKWYIVAAVALLLILYFIIAVTCSPTFHCSSK